MEERKSFNSVDKLTSWQVDKLFDSDCEVVWSLKPESEATLESESLKLLSALLILDEGWGIRDEEPTPNPSRREGDSVDKLFASEGNGLWLPLTPFDSRTPELR